MTAKLLDVTPDEYHLLDGLSSSIASTLITRSPKHAWQQHPRFGGNGKRPTKEMDRGAAIHALVLGKGKQFAILDFEDYKKKAAQEARDAAREQGLIPILSHQFLEWGTAAESIRNQLADRDIYLDGLSEQAIEWHESSAHGPVQCRAMFDHVWLDRGVILDLKITHDANPAKVERSSENFGYAIQETAYRRALAALRPELAGRVDFLFCFVEPEAPYAMNITRGDGVFRELGERRWLRAVETWGECLATDEWPAYGSGVNPLYPPPWALTREFEAA